MDTGDWRSQLQPNSRQRIVNNIMKTLKQSLSSPEVSHELRKIAIRFEEMIYEAAANQMDYIRKISVKMLTMETKLQTLGVPGSLPPNPAGGNQNSPEPGSQNMQPQLQNPGQTLPLPLTNQSRQAGPEHSKFHCICWNVEFCQPAICAAIYEQSNSEHNVNCW
ncbi:hypothetical protein NE237_019784 [Protea cynaroides]|uniref:Mediator complex subunit 15 KIX domain-containing protein n=1 Tax=Protea cynaroides TaxID=273540 RepID=A0A9Q0H9X8_9MAGN|nr:hypothetical protein NE237_019784 [Protea cynaroides]